MVIGHWRLGVNLTLVTGNSRQEFNETALKKKKKKLLMQTCYVNHLSQVEGDGL